GDDVVFTVEPPVGGDNRLEPSEDVLPEILDQTVPLELGVGLEPFLVGFEVEPVEEERLDGPAWHADTASHVVLLCGWRCRLTPGGAPRRVPYPLPTELPVGPGGGVRHVDRPPETSLRL